jgi:hypothetical protein
VLEQLLADDRSDVHICDQERFAQIFRRSRTPLSFLGIFMSLGMQADRNGMLAAEGKILSSCPL